MAGKKLKSALRWFSSFFRDPNLWSSHGVHAYGKYSIAAVSSNPLMEDYAQIEISSSGVFFGIYDGHGGTTFSNVVSRTFFTHLIMLAESRDGIFPDVILDAFAETEHDIMDTVARQFPNDQRIALAGSCCLVGVIWAGRLLIANLGDSRAVLGYWENHGLKGIQLTTDHHADDEQIRNELQQEFPNDPDLIQNINGSWRVKGILQVTKAFGDAFLKYEEFKVGPEIPEFHYPSHLHGPAVKAVPDIFSVQLTPYDRCVILASDGLWNLVSVDRAVEIVNKGPQKKVAKKLIKEAIRVVCQRSGCTYQELKAKSATGGRRDFHDDITVIVIFINTLDGEPQVAAGESMSVRPYMQDEGYSQLSWLDLFQSPNPYDWLPNL